MTDFPSPGVLPLTFPWFSRFGPWQDIFTAGTSTDPAAMTWVADVAAYIPIWNPYVYPVQRVFWLNGTTTTTTNVDMGIYTADGERIYSTGSTAQGSATTVQYVSVATPFLLYPGSYYLAWTCNNTTARAYGRSPPAANGRQVGLLQQASALPLPATMTPVVWNANVGVPFCGFTQTSTGF